MIILFLFFLFFLSFSYSHPPISIGMLSTGSIEEEISLLFGLGFSLDINKVTVAKQTFFPNNSFLLVNSFCRLIEKEIYGLYSPHSSETISTLSSFTSGFQVPHISPSPPPNPSFSSSSSSSFQIFTHPFFPKAVFKLIQYYKWNDLYYFYYDDEGLERLQQLLTIASNKSFMLKIHIFKIKSQTEVKKTLEKINKNSVVGNKILLDLKIELCVDIINGEYEKGSLQGIKHYFILNTLVLNNLPILKVTASGGLNVSSFSMETGRKYWKIAEDFKKFYYNKTNHIFSNHQIPLNLALTMDSGLVLGYGIAKYLESNHHGNQFNESLSCEYGPMRASSRGLAILKYMKQIKTIGLFTGSISLDEWGMRKDYRLELMQISLNKGLAKIGHWKSSDEFIVKQESISRQKGNNMIANKTRIVTSILSAPFLMKLKDPNLTGNAQYEGYCADLTQKVAAINQFAYIIKPVEDGNYGNNKTGKWDGMVGELLSGAADVAIAPLTITADRESVIDFSKPFMSLGISIMIKKPSKDPPSVFSFLNPLSYEVWMCVIFAYIGVSVVLFLVSRFSPFEWQVEENQEIITNNFTIFNSLWFSLGAFMQQGVDIEPRSMSGRIVGSVWWFFTLILISSYTANLAAFLTSERMQSPIESAEDLAKQTEIKYGTVIGGSTQEFFRKSSIPTYERMWAFMSSTDPWVFVKSTDEGVHRVRQKNGKYAFLTESTQNEYTNQRYPCDTIKVGGNLDAKGYGIGTPMGSDLRDRVTLAVLELIENSELANLEKKWWYEKGECSREGTFKKQEATSSLKLSNVAGIFYILVGGLVLGSLIALIEFWHKKMERERKKNNLTPKNKTETNFSTQEVFPVGNPQEVNLPNPHVSKIPCSFGNKMNGKEEKNEIDLQTQV